MPYTFTSWTACTDPASNARTLDWSESGMHCQPAGLYLEALRQAAALRNAVATAGVSDPGTIILEPALGQFPALLAFVDAVAWHVPAGAPGQGWIAAAAVGDFSGDADPPAVLDSEAAILAAAGHATRIGLPTQLCGPLPGDYLRQLRDVLAAKVYYGRTLTIADCSGRLHLDRGGWPPWSNAVSTWETAAAGTWDYPTHAAIMSWVRQDPSPPGLEIDIGRYAAEVTWSAPNSIECSAADLYLYATVVEPDTDPSDWEEPDFGFSAVETWTRLYASRDIGTGLTEWVGKILTVTAAATPLPGYRGYACPYGYVLADFTADWALGA